MNQKRSCRLNSKVDRPFYDLVKIRVVIIYNVNIFTIYETFENVIKILPITYQNKTKMPGKNRNCLIIYKKRQITSTIYKLFEYNSW